MKKILLVCSLFAAFALSLNAQVLFDEELQMPAGYNPNTVVLPPSPLWLQVLFVGQTDMVQTTDTYGNPAGAFPAKEWHDFIGFTPDETGESLGWVSVNHEMQLADDHIGDGGGMTVFRVARNPSGSDELVVLPQTLSDGRSGQFFNVDFANTVGTTGMNCAGISSYADGRIWTAEEWGVSSNAQKAGWDRDTADFTIGVGSALYPVSTGFPGFDGQTIKSYQNLNWMVEIDPREAVAVRKQYNWGRQDFEGGVVLPDNQTAYLGEDATPGYFTKFVADTPGDFTSGTTYVYKEDATDKWVEIDNTDLEKMLNFGSEAAAAGATMYNRLEWVAYDVNSGKVYICETGRDTPGSRFATGQSAGATLAAHHVARATEQGTTATDGAYWDYFGRVLEYDPATNEMSVLLEAGPYFSESPAEADYPAKHLSNPDGIRIMQIDGQSFAVIQEDLNGSDYGRMPAGVPNRTCEVFLLDLSIENPTIDDLIRLTVVPTGAEVTGAVETPDGKSLLINSQHPSTSNPFPYNHSLTFAIHGFDQLTLTDLKPEFTNDGTFQVFPNPTAQSVQFNKAVDVAIYNLEGQRLKVYRNVTDIDVSNFAAGAYFLQTGEGQIEKLIIQK